LIIQNSVSAMMSTVSPAMRRFLLTVTSSCRRHHAASLSAIKMYSTGAKVQHAADPSLYKAAFEAARDRPEEFWAEQAQGITWFKPYDRVLDNSKQPFTQWFPGGELNICYNAVDRHVEAGLADHTAIIYDSPVTGQIQHISYKQLQKEVSLFAGVLSRHGVKKGDRVLIYMPMIPQAQVAMLAAVRLGATHSLVFGGFASEELATRIEHCQPKVVISANCGIEPGRLIEYKPLLDEALRLSAWKPSSCLIYRRTSDKANIDVSMTSGRDYDYSDEMAKSSGHDCVPVDGMHPLYILYTSGTTGLPKAVVRPSAGHAVTLQWSMWNLYGVKPKEVWFSGSDLGWVVGHSYIHYAPLLNGNTTVLFEGKPVGTPDAGTYFRLLQDHNVAAMFVAPTALRAVRRADEDGIFASKYSFPNFRYLFVAGEHCDPETREWAQKIFKSPCIDHWWQTETGSAITTTCVGLGNDLYPASGTAGKPVPGYDVQLHDSKDQSPTGEALQQIVVKLPLGPGAFSNLYKNEEGFVSKYFEKFEGYYDTADAGFIDSEGNVGVMARTDDVINVAGHRLSTSALEQAIMQHPCVVEVAVVGKADALKGQVPLALIILKTGSEEPHEVVAKQLVALVRRVIGPVAAFREVVVVDKLPKTRSGKVARGTVSAMLSGKPYKIPVTIEDVSVYPMLLKSLRSAGYSALEPTNLKS